MTIISYIGTTNNRASTVRMSWSGYLTILLYSLRDLADHDKSGMVPWRWVNKDRPMPNLTDWIIMDDSQ